MSLIVCYIHTTRFVAVFITPDKTKCVILFIARVGMRIQTKKKCTSTPGSARFNAKPTLPLSPVFIRIYVGQLPKRKGTFGSR